MSSDIFLIFQWWISLFFFGAAAIPLTRRWFGKYWDQGYLFTKAIGLATVSYVSWLLASIKAVPFGQAGLLVSIAIVAVVGWVVTYRQQRPVTKRMALRWIILEIFFLLMLVVWSYIKAHEPDIRGLEKFMDYGFSQSIAHARYFPPHDMWYAGGSINYYYFGHVMMAAASILSGVDLSVGYNLMLATLFAFTFTMSFSIVVEGMKILVLPQMKAHNFSRRKAAAWCVGIGLLGAFLVSLSGNMQTIYAFTRGYTVTDDASPPPFWQLLWPFDELVVGVPEGIQRYWYANATRFIPYTIHEFPGYSFVVSDNHGHVLGIPLVLLGIASLLRIFGNDSLAVYPSLRKRNSWLEQWIHYRQLLLPFALYGGLVGLMFMTNALDGPIYLGLMTMGLLVFSYIYSLNVWSMSWWFSIRFITVVLSFVTVTTPFLVNFSSFASGIGINCPPSRLAETTWGPFIFETVDKCQKSPLWMMWLLWGFFIFCAVAFVLRRLQWKKSQLLWQHSWRPIEIIWVVFIIGCLGLLLFPEFFYFKDIYPAHFRSNTMFKLGYQVFIILSILSALSIGEYLFVDRKTNIRRILFIALLVPQLFLVSIFPYFSVRSYFGNLVEYKGLYGLAWFEREYPEDFQAMQFLKHQLATQPFSQPAVGLKLTHLKQIPIILEADGESYTDYNRISAFAGIPTVIGWAVHEWLWRGSYDVVSPRRADVAAMYEAQSAGQLSLLLSQYNVTYIIVGTLEREKYPLLREDIISQVAVPVFREGNTTVYQVAVYR